jgi:hypothetical protein
MNGDPTIPHPDPPQPHLSQTLRERLFRACQAQERRRNLLIRRCATPCLIRHLCVILCASHRGLGRL